MNSPADFSNLIRKHVAEWSNRPICNYFYPKFIYHFTDVNNAVKILESGFVYSRNKAIQIGVMETDNAAAGVINSTNEEHKKFARFYFRPNTPTQFHNEGIRPVVDRYDNAHCPVPIFFAFDKLSVLTRDDAVVSNGNMARDDVVYGPANNMFQQIPFDKVFHNTWFSADEIKDEIVFHRHAEILIPEYLELEGYLVWIGCRSHAERKTLLSLLSPSLSRSWSHLVRLADSSFFQKKWIFVESVDFDGGVIHFTFNRNSRHRGCVSAKLDVLTSDGESLNWQGEIDAKNQLHISVNKQYKWVNVTFWIIDSLAFSGQLTSQDII